MATAVGLDVDTAHMTTPMSKKPMSENSNFSQRVYEIVALIPEGRVTTYGHIAELLGSRRSARIVGWALNQSHASIPDLPAHRVVNRVGLLTGRNNFATPDEMQLRLEAEGIEIIDHQVQDFSTHLWDPSQELSP